MVYFFGITVYSNIYENNSLIMHLDPDNLSTFWTHFNNKNLEISNDNSIHTLHLNFLWQPLRKPVVFIPVINKTHLISILQKKFKKKFYKMKKLKNLKTLLAREIS